MSIIFDEHITPTTPRDYPGEIVEILRSDTDTDSLRDRILDYHANDIAAALELLSEQERHLLYSLLDDDTISSVLEYSDNISDYIEELPGQRRAEVLSELEPAVALEYLEELEDEDRQSLFDTMDSEAQQEIAYISEFDDSMIGSRMTTNFISVLSLGSVGEAMTSLISQSAENDNISTLYAVDREGLFQGAIDLKDLIIARKETPLDSIIMTSYPYVRTTEQIDECIERIKEYSEDSIPVLDTAGCLVGVIMSGDITELVDEELGDDYAKLAGLSSEEDMHEPVCRSIAKRLPWLTVLLFLGLVVSGVVGAFEQVAAHLTVIVCFQSLILGMAGNAGTQALAVTIRVLADDRLTTRHRLTLIGKETRIGLINGSILGILSVVFIGVYIMVFKDHTASYAFSVSLCTGIALLVSILLSAVFGTAIPIMLRSLGADPAVASGPLITTLNDLVAVISYYGIAWLLLIRILGL